MNKFYVNGHANRVTFTKVKDNIYKPSEHVSRVIGDINDPEAIDFSGGPFLMKDNRLRIITNNTAAFVVVTRFIAEGKDYLIQIKL